MFVLFLMGGRSIRDIQISSFRKVCKLLVTVIFEEVSILTDICRLHRQRSDKSTARMCMFLLLDLYFMLPVGYDNN